MKNFIKTILAGLFSIFVHVCVITISVMVGLGFSVIHSMTPWIAIPFFLSLVLLLGMSIAAIFVLGKCALGQLQLIGNKEKESNDNNE